MLIDISNTSKSIYILTSFIFGIALASIFNDISYCLISSSTVLIAFYVFFKIQLHNKKADHYKEIIPVSVLITFYVGIFLFIFSSIYYVYRFNSISSSEISKYAPIRDIKISGIIDSFPEKTSYYSAKMNFIVNNISINNHKIAVSGKSILDILNYNDKLNLIPGSIVSFIGSVALPRDASNPYEFNYKKYLQNNSITALIYTKDNSINIQGYQASFAYTLINHIEKIRKRIIFFHSSVLSKDESALLNGIVLGDNAAPLNYNLKQKFINSGLAHILAASGLNVALLAMLWIFISSKFAPKKRYQYIGAIFIVIFYTLLAGFTPSVLRSAIMLVLVLIGKLFDRNANMIVLVLFAAFILLIFNPLMINDIGFQLSFAATFGLIVTIPLFQKYIVSIPEYIAMLILVPFVCQLWVTPILLYHFHFTSTFSIFSNILALPIVSIITYAGFIANLCGFIPFINLFLIHSIDFIISPLLSWLINIADYFSSLPQSKFFIPFGSLNYVFIYYIALAAFLIFMYKGVKKRYYALLILILLFIVTCQGLFRNDNKQLEVVFFDVGDADAIYIHSPSGKNIIIDGGKRFYNYSSSGKWILEPFLYSRGIKNIDLLILTHPENDHIGGIPELINSFNILNFVDSAFPSKNKAYNSILRTIYTKKIPYTILRQPDIINFQDGLSLKIVNPPENARFKKYKNLNSLAIILNYNKFNMFLAADTEKDQLFNLSQYNVDFDVIKVGHHGSRKSLSEQYLSLLKPEVTIISAGRTKYHPFPTIVQLLKNKSVMNFITKDTGAVQLISNGQEYEIKTFRKDHFK